MSHAFRSAVAHNYSKAELKREVNPVGDPAGRAIVQTVLTSRENRTSHLEIERPGFATLSVVLRAASQGEIDPSALAAFQDDLYPRLENSRHELSRMKTNPSVMDWLEPIISSTEALYDRLGEVLELVDDYLDYDSGDSLEDAISLLDFVQGQLRQVF